MIAGQDDAAAAADRARAHEGEVSYRHAVVVEESPAKHISNIRDARSMMRGPDVWPRARSRLAAPRFVAIAVEVNVGGVQDTEGAPG